MGMPGYGLACAHALLRISMLRFVSDWSCSAKLTRGLPSGLFPLISRTFLTLDVSCHVSCHVLVMCCVTLFCNVPRTSDTSIVVLGFVTHSTIREELQSYLVNVYILRTWEGEP
jgi:hypothetical protein